MLGPIVFLACLVAAVTVTCILFVLFGPVPVKRRITIVSRIQPSPLPVTAAPIMIQTPVAFAPVPSSTLPIPELELVPEFTPPPQPPRRAAHARGGDGSVAPLVIRRPRTEPVRLARAARGTLGRPPHFDTLEVTHRESPAFEADDHTAVDPSFS